jgi:hypothetical protein
MQKKINLIRTAEQNKQRSILMKKMWKNIEYREKVRLSHLGNKNHFFGKKHTDITKDRIRLARLGKKLSKETKLKIGLSNKGVKKSDEDREGCRRRMKINYRLGKLKLGKGETHWNWKGGITPLNKHLRACSKWKIWRELIFLRDNFTCQNFNCVYCNNKIGVMLHPHHIKPCSLHPDLAFDVENGITYCEGFHIHSKELHKEIIKTLKGGSR